MANQVRYAAPAKKVATLRPIMERIASGTRRAHKRIDAPKAPGHDEAGRLALAQLERAAHAWRCGDGTTAIDFVKHAEAILLATNTVAAV